MKGKRSDIVSHLFAVSTAVADGAADGPADECVVIVDDDDDDDDDDVVVSLFLEDRKTTKPLPAISTTRYQ